MILPHLLGSIYFNSKTGSPSSTPLSFLKGFACDLTLHSEGKEEK
jgi:hypothetical protein